MSSKKNGVGCSFTHVLSFGCVSKLWASRNPLPNRVHVRYVSGESGKFSPATIFRHMSGFPLQEWPSQRIQLDVSHPCPLEWPDYFDRCACFSRLCRVLFFFFFRMVFWRPLLLVSFRKWCQVLP